MSRCLFILFIFALSSCKQKEQAKVDPTLPANHSQQRMEKQREDLAKFVADFDAAMLAKYGRSTFPPEIIDTAVFRIEDTRIFNYNLWVSLHERGKRHAEHRVVVGTL